MNARAALSIASGTGADLLSLTKPRLSSLVVATAAGGVWLAPGSIAPLRAAVALLAIAGMVGAANALNCYLERDSDQLMERTRDRPLPAGRMEPQVALWFGLSLAAASLPALWLSTNLVTAALSLLAFATYVLAYTPLKAKSTAAVWVGAIPGALPPLMGWTCVTGRIDLAGLSLFSILFLWQVPHFLSIGIFRKEEYRAARLLLVPQTRGDRSLLLEIALYVVALGVVGTGPYFIGLAGPVYLAGSIVLGAIFAGVAALALIRAKSVERSRWWARRLFLSSLIYLVGLFGVLSIDVMRGL